MELLNQIIEILNQNSVVFISIFLISLLANLIQIYTFIRDRRRLQEELGEKEQLLKLVETYEYILDLAKQNIKTEEQLGIVEKEISQKAGLVGEMEARVEMLQQVAQKKLVSQALERNIALLLQIYEDVVKLRRDYESLGDLPDIPQSKRREIEEQVTVALKRPYEFPRSFAFKSILLVLFVFLLPWPIDTLLILVFLHVFLGTFFEAVVIYEESHFVKWILKNANWLGVGSAVGIWLSAFSALTSFIPISIFISGRLERIAEIVLSIVPGLLHWRIIRKRVLSPLQEFRA